MYSETVLDHFHSPRHAGGLDNPDAMGTAGVPGRGNYMVIHLKVSDGQITEIGFLTYGCPGAIASGSMLCEMVHGQSLAQAAEITGGQVLERLGKLPLGKRHCPHLAVEALRHALNQHERKS